MSLSDIKKIAHAIETMELKGATPIAYDGIKSLKKLSRFKDLKKARKILWNARPNEPMLYNGLNYIENESKNLQDVKETSHVYCQLIENATIETICNAQDLIKKGATVMTHCSSSLVQNAIILAHKEDKKVKAINTETRPVYQGRKTSKKLAREGIKVTHIIDSKATIYMKNADLILLGCDVLGKDYIINKAGTQMYADIAKLKNKKIYSMSQLLKFWPEDIDVEKRDSSEVWDTTAKNVKVENPIFDKVKIKDLTGIVTESGIIKKNIKKEAKRMYDGLL